LPKKLEVNYDRQIFKQLEEMIEKSEKLEKIIGENEILHRREVKELKERYTREIYEQSIEREKIEKAITEKIEKREEKKQRNTAQGKIAKAGEYEKEISRLKRYYEKGIGELRREYRAEISELKEIVWRQASEIEKLKTENAALRGIVNQNSGNSSKPPSSDGYRKIQNSRAPTGKKVGGQLGHKGHQPEYYANPTQIIEIKASKCRCGGRFKYTEKMYSRKQLVDIEIKTNVTENPNIRGYANVAEVRVLIVRR